MIAAGMGYPRGLLQLLLVLTFTAVGTQAHCGSEEISQMRPCVSPHMRKLLPLINAFCNPELITQDLCNPMLQWGQTGLRSLFSSDATYANFWNENNDFMSKFHVFKEIKDCASRKDIAACVEYNDFEKLSESGDGYSCGLMDFQDKCGNATMSKTKTASQAKDPKSKGAASTSRASLFLVLVFTIRLLLMSI